MSYEELESVVAMRKLHATLGEQLDMIVADSQTPEEASQGMQMLLRVLAMATDVSEGNPRAPHFARSDTPARKIGGDNPDAEYDVVKLDGQYRYRVSGNAGAVSHLSLTFNGGGAGRRETFAYLNESSLGIADNGDFTLLLSRTKPSEAGTWVETPDGPYSFMVRQFIGSRETEDLATYEIEVLDNPEELALQPHTDEELAGRIRSTEYAFQFMSMSHRLVMPEMFDTPHVFLRANSDELGADISGSDNLYMFATFDLAEDEALVIDVQPLDVSYWNIAVMTRFWESIDHMARPTSRTMAEVTPEPDGAIRLVLTHGQAVHPNWLDTAGHRYGIMTFRWVGPRDAITELPTASVVKVTEFDQP